MWQIIKSEIKYNGILLSGFLGLIPLLFLLEVSLDDAPRFFILILAFMLQLYWIIFRNKDKRDIQQARLPLPLNVIGSARIITGISTAFILLAAYSIIGLYFEYDPNIRFTINLITIIIYLAVLSGGLSVYLILRDTLLYHLRNNPFYQLTPERSKTILILITLFINLLGVYSLLTRPEIIGTIMKFFLESQPDALDVLLICLISAVLALLTIPAFSNRKSYIE